MDQDDQTNLPPGLAWVCKNMQWSLTSARTRDGVNATIQGVNKSPITGLLGLVYQPPTSAEVSFQRPLLFDMQGTLQAEYNVGGGKTRAVPANPLLNFPANMHMIGVQAYNKAWLAFSDLLTPKYQMAVYNMKTDTVDPYGMKPFGWVWQPNTPVVVGEVATPTVLGGNGHTYRCIQAGVTSANEPSVLNGNAWPLVEGGIINDGTAKWQELTPVLANRLPEMPKPVLTLGNGGIIPPNKDVYVLFTLQNGIGETIGSVSSKVTTDAGHNALYATIPAFASLPGWVRGLPAPYAVTFLNIYVAIVNAGAAAPIASAYQFYAGIPPLGFGVDYFIANGGGLHGPQTFNTARITPGYLPTPTVAPGVTRTAGGGTFAAGRDVYICQTYVNGAGETNPGPPGVFYNTTLNDTINVAIPNLQNYKITAVNLYEADVPAGQGPPPFSQFGLVGSFAPNQTVPVTAPATGNPPPVANTTGPGGDIVADSNTGGPNNTQGFRYAAIQFINRNNSVSGFTKNAVFKVAVDQNGWELSIFNVPIGPSNITARQVSFTSANGTAAGPFFPIGNPNVGQPGYLVYPNTTLQAGVNQTATIFGDNATTSGTFNFQDSYLINGVFGATTDRLRVIWPGQAVDIFYDDNTDRMFQTGVPGFNGHWVSLAGDPESYYGDTCFIPVQGKEKALCVKEYRGTLFSCRELSGWAIQVGSGDPSTWPKPVRRWKNKGPCGPRAIDSCEEFMIFVHRSGVYRFVDTEADLVSKEVPKLWKRINWRMQHVICVRIDEENKMVRILVPLGNSQQPNAEIVISYLEGWNNPIHFSTFSQREISMDAARRYGVNDVQAYVMERVERTIPNAPTLLVEGVEGIDEVGADWYRSQWLYGSSGPDGTVNAITPGIFQDNGTGIKWEYETVSPQQGMQMSKCEGFSLNAKGFGQLIVSAIAGRVMTTDWAPDGSPKKGKQLFAKPIFLRPDQDIGISRMFESHTNERWRLRFCGDGSVGNWCELKWVSLYTIAVANAQARSEERAL